MQTLKKYVKTFARLKASMAKGYTMSETLGYRAEYMQRFSSTSYRMWDHVEEQRMNDEMVEGNGWKGRCLKNSETGLMNLSSITL